MKRLLPLIPIILLLFLVNSCAPNLVSAASSSLTPIPTEDLAISTMVKSLNFALPTVSPLGWFIDAQYYVTGVTVWDIPGGTEKIAQINVECICMNETDCCLPERAFVAIVESMRSNNSQTIQALGKFRELRIACSNHQTKDPIGTIAVSWLYVEKYLRDPSNALELGGQLHHTPPP